MENKLCDWCGEPILPVNQEKYDKTRDTYYCERCSDTYWEEVETEEGPDSYGIRN